MAGTTKGTGGDIIILEEAAYVDPGFFYETVAPLLLVGVTSLICISTLTSEINFYTRLFKIRDPVTGLPIFSQLQVTLACEQCKNEGKAAQCKHMLHLVPQWQSSARHERLKAVMCDRPDLIQSELAVSLYSYLLIESLVYSLAMCRLWLTFIELILTGPSLRFTPTMLQVH